MFSSVFPLSNFSRHYKKTRDGSLSAKNTRSAYWGVGASQETHRRHQVSINRLSAARGGNGFWHVNHIYVLLCKSLFPRLLAMPLHTKQAVATPRAAWRRWKAGLSTDATLERIHVNVLWNFLLEFCFEEWWRTAWGIWISSIYFPGLPA